MLKFTVDKPTSYLVFFGLSEENIRRLRASEPIQMPASDVGLGDGIVMIAHERDRGINAYRDAHETKIIRELILLDDEDCKVPNGLRAKTLKSMVGDKPAGAYVFTGTTELGMLAHMRQFGFVDDTTNVVSTTRSYPLGVLDRIKVIGAGLVAFFLAGVIYYDQPHQSALASMFVLAGTVCAFLAVARWKDRVETDVREIRNVAFLGGFTVARADVRQVDAYNDSLGPYEVLIRLKNGSTKKLKRGFDDWDELVADVASR